MNRAMVAATLLGVVLTAQTAAGQGSSSDTYRQLQLFGDVFERARSDYVEEVKDDELIEAAINGMLTSLDPHSSYLNAKTYRDMQVQTKGEFGGLGIEVTMENGLVKVVSPIDDTPAFRAGVKAGDFITRIDGIQVLGLTLNEAVEKMRGPVNSNIALTISRPGTEQPFDLSITRAIIKIDPVRGRAEGSAAYIRITSFNEQTEASVKKALETVRKELGDKFIGVVLDLRNNPGGLLEQAFAVSDAFLDHGEIVSTRGRQADDIQRFAARGGDIADGKPIVVLINGGSASASEIVAGALQDHRRALVMGTKSFGKGSVQTIIPLSGHGAMRLTTSRYYTPSGRSIQATGIEPDIEVVQSRIEALETGPRRSEATLRNALRGEAAPAAAEPANAPADGAATAPEDYQLLRALDLLRGLTLYSAKPN
jgi:carboxyl-terminal processing protease